MTWNVAMYGKASTVILAINSATLYTSLVTLWSGMATPGYNKVNISPPRYFAKGTLLDFYLTTGTVAINIASTAPIKDFSWSQNQPLATGNHLFVNVITQPKYGQMTGLTTSITHNYSTAGTYYIHPEFSCDSTVYCDFKAIVGKNERLRSLF